MFKNYKLSKNLIMKIKSIIKFSFFLLSISIMFVACQWITIEPVETDKPDDPNNTTPVSLANDLQPIFTSNCIACHTSRNPVLTVGNTYNSLTTGGYVNTSTPSASKIVVKTDTGHGGLTPSQKTKLLTWIQQGALNN
jgi:mono/diheme cytochrome c family protein